MIVLLPSCADCRIETVSESDTGRIVEVRRRRRLCDACRAIAGLAFVDLPVARHWKRRRPS